MVCTAGRDSSLRNRTSLSPIREKGDKVFWGALCATTDFFVTDAPDSDDYFPHVDNLLNDMEDTDPKSSASALVAVTPSLQSRASERRATGLVRGAAPPLLYLSTHSDVM